MTLIELRDELRKLCEKEGSAIAWAKKHKIAHSYVSAIIRGDKKPGQKILKAMGGDMGVKLIKEYKYKDIGQAN